MEINDDILLGPEELSEVRRVLNHFEENVKQAQFNVQILQSYIFRMNERLVEKEKISNMREATVAPLPVEAVSPLVDFKSRAAGETD